MGRAPDLLRESERGWDDVAERVVDTLGASVRSIGRRRRNFPVLPTEYFGGQVTAGFGVIWAGQYFPRPLPVSEGRGRIQKL